MAITAKDGTGTTITFGTSAFAANLIDVDGPGQERGAIDVTHMASTEIESLEASLVDGGDVGLTFEYLGSDDPPIDQPAEEIIIDWAGAGTGYKSTFSGFLTNFRPRAAIGERMTATATLKVAGAVLPAQE